MTSFQNLDGLLGGFAFFVSQNHRDYLVVWHRLTVELVTRAARGLQPNRSPNDVILEGRDESGRVL